MSFLGNALKNVFGSSSAGSDAAGIEQQFNREAIEEIKKQLGITTENIAPFLEAGTGALPDVIQGTSAEGLAARLKEIFSTDIFGSLVDERGRAVQGQLSAGGLTRSGTAFAEAAKVPTDVALAIENLLTGRSTNLANQGQNAALGLGKIGAQSATSIAELLKQSGIAGSSGAITDAQSKAKSSQNILNTALSIGAFFSDPTLKENVKKIGTINDLTLYQWDWIEAVKGSIITDSMAIGFMADEVKEKYPKYVKDYGGFMVIKYPELLDTLEATYSPKISTVTEVVH